MKETILKKAWKITAKDLFEPWYYDEIIVLAETRGEARSKGLSELIYQGATIDAIHKYQDNEIKYIDVIATRDKYSDVILYEGKELRRRDLKSYLWCKERDESARLLTISNPQDLAVVYAGCYGQYWGANHSGYSSNISFAGKYTTEEAYKIVRGSSYDRQEAVRLLDIKQFNSEIDLKISAKETEIERLKTYRLNG
jgi:hypothetical protein